MRKRIQQLSSSIRQVLEVTHVNKIAIHAASACYFMVLAVFPLLVLVLSVLRYTPLELQTLIELLDRLVPAALMGAVERLVRSTYENSSTALPDRILVRTSAMNDSMFFTCGSYLYLWAEIYVENLGAPVGTVGHFYNIMEWISDEEAERLKREGM